MACYPIIEDGKNVAFICGDKSIKPDYCKKCGDTIKITPLPDEDGFYSSDGNWKDNAHLCDFPLGKGKTCDALLCDKCCHHIGDNLDLCDYHYHLYKEQLGEDNIYWLRKRRT